MWRLRHQFSRSQKSMCHLWLPPTSVIPWYLQGIGSRTPCIKEWRTTHSQPSASTDPQPGIKSTIFKPPVVESADVKPGIRRVAYVLKNLGSSYLFCSRVDCVIEALFGICSNLALSRDVTLADTGRPSAHAPGRVWRPAHSGVGQSLCIHSVLGSKKEPWPKEWLLLFGTIYWATNTEWFLKRFPDKMDSSLAIC